MDNDRAVSGSVLFWTTFLTIIAYIFYVYFPDRDIAKFALAVSTSTFILVSVYWFAESLLAVLGKYTDWQNEALRQRTIASDKTSVRLQQVAHLTSEQLRYARDTGIVDLPEDEIAPLPGFTVLTRPFAVRWLDDALNYNLDLPAIRAERDKWKPREQAQEITAWLIKNKYACPARGSRTAQWKDIQSKLEAAGKFWREVG